MHKIEGIVVVIYDDSDLTCDYRFIIVPTDYDFYHNPRILVQSENVPPDIEKMVKSNRVWVVVDANDEPIIADTGYVIIHPKTMNIRELLLNYAPSKELKQRLNNGQIKINNEPIKSYDVEVDFDTSFYQDLPDFLGDNNVDFDLIMKERRAGINVMDFFGSPTMADSSTNVNRYKFLEGYVLLTVSKHEHMVFFNNDNYPVPYSITYVDERKVD